MATGIPGKNAYISNSINTNISFQLNYEGKIPAEYILKTQPAKLKHVVTVDKNLKNKLIYGENLRVLSSLLKDPTVAGKVGLIYIDPPYATGSSFESRKSDHAYHDCMSGAVYLEFLRQRLILLKELLSEQGAIYVHLDENMAFPVKIIMDEIFGASIFKVQTITLF